MIFRGLDQNGDWLLGQSLGSFAKDAAALNLCWAARLRSWRGDCFFSLNDYVDWKGRRDVNQEGNLAQELGAVSQ